MKPFSPAALLLSAVLVGGVTGPVRAQTIAFDEAVSGDISEHTDPFVLGIGRNTFSGSVSVDYPEAFNSFVDWDDFAFVVPDGARLVSIVYSIALTAEGSGFVNAIGYQLVDELPPSIISISGFDARTGRADLSVPLVNQELLLNPLPPSRYGLVNRASLGGALAPGDFRRAVYTWSLEVEACPAASSCRSPFVVTDAVTFEPIKATYYLAGTCSLGPGQGNGEIFGFKARLTMREAADPLTHVFLQVAELTPGRYLQNVGRAGAIMVLPETGQYADGLLTAGEWVDVPFAICLPNRDPFVFLVDVWTRSD